MKIELLEQDATHARYRVLDDDGNELRQIHRDVTHELAAAKRDKKGLVFHLAKSEDVELAASAPKVAQLSVNKEAPIVHDHGHEEFEFLAAAEHSHPHEHPHEHEHEHPQKPHEHPLEPHAHPHEHPLVAHGHGVIDARLSELEGRTELQRTHEHLHEHVHSHEELVALQKQIANLSLKLYELEVLIKAPHVHPELVHNHPPVEHSHKDLEAMLGEHIENVARRSNARILSEESTNGKRRLILEVD